MTVGIGAVCEDGKSAVVAADKMVTFAVGRGPERPGEFALLQAQTDWVTKVGIAPPEQVKPSDPK